MREALGAWRKEAIFGMYAVLALEIAVGCPLLRLLLIMVKPLSSESARGRGYLGLAEEARSGSTNLEGLDR